MSYTYLLEREGESWEECSSDTPQFALWKLNLTAEKSCSNASETESCQSSPSGMMCELSTASLGKEKSMLFAEASLVRTYHAPEKVPDSTASEAASGLKCLGSLARWNLETSSWKTHQCSLFGDLEPFSGTWPRWGMMRGGECWELSTPARLTSENESGLWPTPQAHKTTRSGELVNVDGTPWDGIRKPHSKTSGRPITTALADAVAKWPTPQARDWKNGSRKKWDEVMHHPEKKRSRDLNDAVAHKEDLATGHLNPTWVEWLMGWPLGWTDCAASATGKFRQWCDSHGGH